MLFIYYLISYLNSRLVILITIRLSVPRLRWPDQLLKPGGRLWGLSFYTSSSIHLLPGATFYFILIPLESFWQTLDIKTYQVDLAIVINTVPPTHETRICIYSAAEAFYQVRKKKRYRWATHSLPPVVSFVCLWIFGDLIGPPSSHIYNCNAFILDTDQEEVDKGLACVPDGKQFPLLTVCRWSL